MANAKRRKPEPAAAHRWTHPACVALLLVLSGVLAITSLVGDSITFDETPQITAGVSYLRTGDFRLLPDHPPLAQMWTAWPILLTDYRWPPETSGWHDGNYWKFGRAFLFELNDGEKLIVAPRCLTVALLLGACLCVYATGRTLFGPAAGLLALTLAVLSPSMLAHGRLATTDMMATLLFTLTFLTFARLAKSITWPKLLAAAFAFAALALTKFTWPLVVPCLVLMGAIAVFSSEPMRCSLLLPMARPLGEWDGTGVRLTKRTSRAVVLAVIVLFTGAITLLSIWTCFGWRYHSLRDHEDIAARRALSPESSSQIPNPVDWDRMAVDSAGNPIRGPLTSCVQWARARRLLPEAYLYGLAFTRKATEERRGYLMGEYSITGWPSYFPIAFAIKTPIAMILLFLGGVCAILTRKATWRMDVPLLSALVAFAFIYTATTITSHFNIGHRHILPLYPIVMIVAGASVAWLKSRAGRWLVGCAVVWLLMANAWVYPHYLCYFNELIGGPSRGHLYLADSNIDWGQEMKRLGKYARAHPEETIKLAHFGSADPMRYGFEVEMLPSFLGGGKWADLTAGTYVVSATQLMGVYMPRSRDVYWTREILEEYRSLRDALALRVPEGETEAMRRARLGAARHYELLRRSRMLQQLRHREPDERIGYALFVYHLNQAEVDALLGP